MLRTWRVLLLAWLAAAAGVSCDRAADGPAVRVSVPADAFGGDTDDLAPLVSALQGELGVPVHIVEADDTESALDRFRRGRANVAWLDATAIADARSEVAGTALLAHGRGDRSSSSYLIAHPSTRFEYSTEFPTAVVDVDLAVGSRRSTGGFVMPQTFVRLHTGREGAWTTVSSPRVRVDAVSSGRFTVGAVASTVYDELVVSGHVDPRRCRVIWRTPTYANYAFVAHPSLDETFGPGFVDRLRAALLGPNGSAMARSMGRSDFVGVTDDTFRDVWAAASQLPGR